MGSSILHIVSGLMENGTKSSELSSPLENMEQGTDIGVSIIIKTK
jgi:hypothetical protein